MRPGPDAAKTHIHKRTGRGATLMSHGGNALQRSDVDYMRRALELAAEAQAKAEVPVGAVLVDGGGVVAVGSNCPISSHDPTAHAEVVAMRAAGQALGNYRLNDTTLYVTLEPCIMCAAAIVHARVRRLVFGAWDPACGRRRQHHQCICAAQSQSSR